jgi:hypothetical protein
MSVAAMEPTAGLPLGKADVAKAAVRELSPRTRVLLQGPIVPTLLRMAWPNVLVMFAQAASGLIETWFVAKLGTDALAGMALVFPGVMLMQMISAGAMGGGISSAIARAPTCALSDQPTASSAWVLRFISRRRARDDSFGRCPPASCACWSPSPAAGSRFA